MVIIVLVLWTFTCLLWLNSKENKYMRWAAATSFIGGYGAFGRLLIESLVPSMEKNSLVFANLKNISQWVYISATLLNIIFLPSVFLVFVLTYISPNTKNSTKILVILPSVLTLIYTITSNPVFPKPHHQYRLLAIWVLPYIILSFYFIIKKYSSETNPLQKQTDATAILISLPVAFQMFSVYISRLFGFEECFRFNALFFFLFLPLVIYYITQAGILGLKINFEKKNLNYSIKVMTNGTAMLLHALKNKIIITEGCLDNIKSDYIRINMEIPEEVGILEDSTSHMLEMIDRIQEKTQDIVIIKELTKLNDLIDSAVYMFNNTVVNRKVKIKVSCPSNLEITCDSVQIKEVIVNIIKNAIEAINNGNGKIEINVTKAHNKVIVSIEDNGNGICSQDLTRVFQPFYSTKGVNHNYGLGLTYCYQVIEKHNGKIYITSRPGRGTTVTFYLPLNMRSDYEQN
jgi:two-component system sporulation sensor kinase B